MEVDGIKTYNENGEEFTKESLIAGIINHLQLSEASEDSKVKYESKETTEEKYDVKPNGNKLVIVPKDIGETSVSSSKTFNMPSFESIGLSTTEGIGNTAFNVKAAVETGYRNAYSTTQHACATYVRYMIEAGFGMKKNELFGKTPRWACNYDPWLSKNGFNHILTITGRNKQTIWTRDNAMPGDIAVMDHGTYGHICMFNGRNWVSDFVQNNMWVYGGDGTCRIFRYMG